MVALRNPLALALGLALILCSAVLCPAQDAASDDATALLKKGTDEYKAFEFKTAKQTLLKLDRDKLAKEDQQVYDDYLLKLDTAIKEQAAAQEAFNSAEKALKSNDLAKAQKGFTQAAKSAYLPAELRQNATDQLAIVEEKIKMVDTVETATTETADENVAVTDEEPATEEAPATEETPATEEVAATEETPATEEVATTEEAPAEDVVVAAPDGNIEEPVAQVAPRRTTGNETDILSRLHAQTRIAQQEADIEFNNRMGLAKARREGARSAQDFNSAADAARAALNILDTNKTAYTAEMYRTRLTRVNSELDLIASSREEFQNRQASQERKEILEVTAAQAQRVRVERQMKIEGLVQSAVQLTKEGDFERALGTVDEILKLDPNNDFARTNQPMLRQYYILQKESKANQTRIFEEQKQWVDIRESEIPWYSYLTYPDDWVKITHSRSRYAAGSAGISEADAAINERLRTRLAKVGFEDIEFANVITFLRESSNANIDVNWNALSQAGIEKSTKVNVRLNDVSFEKALKVILANVGGTTELGFVVDEGVITISTKEELSKATITRAYDINDMIIRVPNFTPTSADISGNNTSGTNNGGGGASLDFGGGDSGGDSNNEGEDNIPTKGEIISQIMNMITSQIDSESWKPEGTVGSISEIRGQLVVTQTAENHAKIANLIAQLREAQMLQICVEARFITVSSGFLETIGLDLSMWFNLGSPLGANVTRNANGQINGPLDPFTGAVVLDRSMPSGWGSGFPGNDNFTPIGVIQNTSSFANMIGKGTGIGSQVSAPSLSIGGAFLDDVQVSFLLQATQANATTRTLTAPRITIYNGQRAYVDVGTQQAYVANFNPVVSDNVASGTAEIGVVPTGTRLDVEATVSHDRRYVTMTVRPLVSTLNGLTSFTTGTPPNGITIQLPNVTQQRLETTVSVPDGGTLLLGGQKLAFQMEREQGVPLLSKIPIINRLFTNRGMQHDESTLLILIKPKIIIHREIEEETFGAGLEQE